MKVIVKEYKKRSNQGIVLRTYLITDEQGDLLYIPLDKWPRAYKVACELASFPENVEYQDCGFEE